MYIWNNGAVLACGLKTVKHQMKLRKLLLDSTMTGTSDTDNGSTSNTCISSGPSTSSMNEHKAIGDRKLTIKELSRLAPEEKKAYLTV